MNKELYIVTQVVVLFSMKLRYFRHARALNVITVQILHNDP
jgi:hypothetical protein